MLEAQIAVLERELLGGNTLHPDGFRLRSRFPPPVIDRSRRFENFPNKFLINF
jgi:hypothetical protein